jgi:DNA-binding Xre family transcriptional regulator
MSVQNAFEAYFVDLNKVYSINKKISTYLKVKCLNHSILYTPMGTTKANMSHLLKADEMKLSQFVSICKILKVRPTLFFTDIDFLN